MSIKQQLKKQLKKKNAYVTLVMLNPKYTIGAITLAQSLKMTNTKFDIVCMVTPDIFENVPIYNILLEHFTHIIKVDYVQFKTKPFLDKRKDTYQWIDKSYTKLSVMLLDQYEKVCMLDSDMIITNNIDHLFELQTPIGVFSNHWFDHIKPLVTSSDCNLKYKFNNNLKSKSCNYYWHIKPLDQISPTLIHKALTCNGFVASGNLLVLTPNKNEFKEMINILINKQPFGFNCSSGADEQSICYYQSIIKKRSWTCLMIGYNVVPWKLRETLMFHQKPFIIHFNMTPKPWEMNRGKYIDIEIWWAYANSILNIREICLNVMIEYDTKFQIDYCPFCIILKKKKRNHYLSECTNLHI
jgi:alpha-N-acetylglucosamine transferase